MKETRYSSHLTKDRRDDLYFEIIKQERTTNITAFITYANHIHGAME